MPLILAAILWHSLLGLDLRANKLFAFSTKKRSSNSPYPTRIVCNSDVAIICKTIE